MSTSAPRCPVVGLGPGLGAAVARRSAAGGSAVVGLARDPARHAVLAGAGATLSAGALAAVQAVLPGMRAAGRGSLLPTGGGLAPNPTNRLPAVCLAIGEAGLRSLALTLHPELAPEGIHAGAITVDGPVARTRPSTPTASPTPSGTCTAIRQAPSAPRWSFAAEETTQMITRRRLGLATAGLSFLPLRRAAGYTPGRGLEVAKYDRPGEGSVNSFLLIGPHSLVIVDGQRTLVESRQVVALARGLGLPVEAIFLSHEHPDHCGGLKAITDAFPDAPLLASEPTRDWLARNGAGMMAFMRSLFGDRAPDSVPMPTRVLRPGERITLAGTEFTVDQLGPCEASEGMTMLHSEAESLLVAADLFGNRATPWLLDGTTRGWISELEKAVPRYQGVQTALPGHGAAAPAGVLIAEQLGYLRDFHALVRAEMQGGAVPDAGKARIRAAVTARYPGAPRVAPQPNLIELNADAVAKELANG